MWIINRETEAQRGTESGKDNIQGPLRSLTDVGSHLELGRPHSLRGEEREKEGQAPRLPISTVGIGGGVGKE